MTALTEFAAAVTRNVETVIVGKREQIGLNEILEQTPLDVGELK